MEELRAVIDTNVFVGALVGKEGFNRQILRLCLQGKLRPLIGQTLFLEYEDVLSRQSLFDRSPLSREEREELFDAFLSVSEWVQIYYLWRPNLRDETDNFLVELAIAGGAQRIVTNNVRDFADAEIQMQGIEVVTPSNLLKEMK